MLMGTAMMGPDPFSTLDLGHYTLKSVDHYKFYTFNNWFVIIFSPLGSF